MAKNHFFQQTTQGTNKLTNQSNNCVQKINKQISKIIDTISNLIYPPKCALCQKPLQDEEWGICELCYESRGLILDCFCQKCGKSISENQIFCYDCSHQQHLYVQGHSLFSYPEIKSTIMAIKYQKARWRAVGLAKLMAWLYEEVVKEWEIEAIVFVPQSFMKLGEKGYNPPEVIARVLAQKWDLPLIKNSLKVHHKWRSQKTLNRWERKENLKNTFYCNDFIPYERVLLIDDVYTTGATINACCFCLMKNGAKQVYFLTLASGS